MLRAWIQRSSSRILPYIILQGAFDFTIPEIMSRTAPIPEEGISPLQSRHVTIAGADGVSKQKFAAFWGCSLDSL